MKSQKSDEKILIMIKQRFLCPYSRRIQRYIFQRLLIRENQSFDRTLGVYSVKTFNMLCMLYFPMDAQAHCAVVRGVNKCHVTDPNKKTN